MTSEAPTWDEVPDGDEPKPAPPPTYEAPRRVIGIQFEPVPPDRDVLWDAE